MIYTSYSQFPKGTVHVIGVDAEHTPESPHIAALLDDHYFVCADNGVLSFILQKFRPTKAVVINIHDRIYSNFTVLDAFVQVACHIKRGGTLEVIGEPINELKSLPGILPILSNDSTSIRGKVIFKIITVMQSQTYLVTYLKVMERVGTLFYKHAIKNLIEFIIDTLKSSNMMKTENRINQMVKD